MEVSNPAVHVPAWKRLGLKLKNASTTNESQKVVQPLLEPKALKRKAQDISGAKQPSSDHAVALSPTHGSHQPQPKRKKSVAFANGTKNEDGDANQNLLEDFLAAQHGGEGQFTRSEVSHFTAPSKLHPGNEPSSKPSKADKEAKKIKKEQPGNHKSEVNDKPQQEPVYVSYLKEFRNSRATWKFNKSKQSKLIHNLYNTYWLPSEMDQALSLYLCGLQGEAWRNQLIQDAEKIISDTETLEGAEPNMTDLDEARRKALKAQLKQTKGNLRNQQAADSAYSTEHQEKLSKRKRAMLVIQSLKAQTPFAEDDDEAVMSVKLDPDSQPLRKKSRRSRRMKTGVPDDDDTDETSSVSSVDTSGQQKADENGGSESGSDSVSSSDESDSFTATSDTSDSSDEDRDSDSDSDSD